MKEKPGVRKIKITENRQSETQITFLRQQMSGLKKVTFFREKAKIIFVQPAEKSSFFRLSEKDRIQAKGKNR